MAIYKNINSTGITTLISKGGRTGGAIKKITISNNSTTNHAVISVQIFDESSTGYNIIGNLDLPNGTTLVLEDNLAFNSKDFSLRMEVSGTSPILDVIIK